MVGAAIRSAPILFVSVGIVFPAIALAIAIAFSDGVGAIIVAVLLWFLLLVFASAAALVRLLLKTTSALERNGFGMCDGHTQTDVTHIPLTDWLGRAINRAAGWAEGPPGHGR